jgi:hypothetical protein
MRRCQGWFGGSACVAGQGYAKMPVAFERGHQIFEVSSRVGRFRKAGQRAFDDLPADQ